jgi:ribosome-associated toxin RatA of RatAB toxin-antitoxin module
MAFSASASGQKHNLFVHIRSQKGVYFVKGEFYVQASVENSWKVLTDYNHIADFVGNVDSSDILEQKQSSLIIRQEISGKVLFINKTFRLKLLIHEHPRQLISFTDISRKSFSIYEGSWELTPFKGESKIIYRLKAKPRGWAPLILGQHAFKSNARTLLDEIRSEIIRRSAG